jgi:hypothetical protein
LPRHLITKTHSSDISYNFQVFLQRKYNVVDYYQK